MSRYPWRDTSTDISGGQPPQWETPQGAQKKANDALTEAKEYTDQQNVNFNSHIADTTIHVTTADKANWNSKAPGAHTHSNATTTDPGFMSVADKLKLDASTSAANKDVLMKRDAAGRAKVAAPTEADDIARKAETDAVQGNLDSHSADTVKHVTAADHTKLAGIAEGAEVNQNTFAKVNDVEASSKSDTLKLAGGTGITVTTDPATKRVTVTATGTATPGAHASSHVTGGSDVIPDAVTDGASGLMSGADAKFVRQDGETKVGAQAKANEVKDYIDGRLDTPERAAITLQPGVHVVNANQDAAFKLAGLQGKTVLNYQSQIGIFGVLNPYVIRYGANLLPPFYEWVGIGNIRVDAPYDMTVTAASTTQEYLRYEMQPIAGQVYTISGANIRVVDFTNLVILAFTGNTVSTQTFTVPSSCKVLWIIASNVTQATIGTDSIVTSPGTYRVQNPMLNIGNVGLPFVPREDSMLALQTELHANPDTGANSDMLFEKDGQYFKLAKWKRITELSALMGWTILDNGTGWKSVASASNSVPAAFIVGPVGVSFGTKFDGKVLGQYASPRTADMCWIASDSSVRVSISNSDSGWGDAYTPTVEEIKAYFIGWRMCDAISALAYTGASGEVKCWAPIANPANVIGSGGNWKDVVMENVPTYAAPISEGYKYTPYQLLYQLVTPTVEPITSEGQLTFFDGDNQVEVGTGIVLRENVKPVLLGSYYEFNNSNSGLVSSKFTNSVHKVLSVYSNSKLVNAWTRVSAGSVDTANGERFNIAQQNYDPSAAYSVTYLMLDKYPIVDITGTYAENEKALLLDAVKSIQESTTRISVLESKKAEKDSPTWITPTLLNGWVNFGGTNSKAGYVLINGIVFMKGTIASGAITNGTVILTLPLGYRSKERKLFTVYCNGTTGVLSLLPDGRIVVDILSSGAAVSLDNIIFMAEQ